jgi:hypothetical protein
MAALDGEMDDEFAKAGLTVMEEGLPFPLVNKKLN